MIAAQRRQIEQMFAKIRSSLRRRGACAPRTRPRVFPACARRTYADSELLLRAGTGAVGVVPGSGTGGACHSAARTPVRCRRAGVRPTGARTASRCRPPPTGATADGGVGAVAANSTRRRRSFDGLGPIVQSAMITTGRSITDTIVRWRRHEPVTCRSCLSDRPTRRTPRPVRFAERALRERQTSIAQRADEQSGGSTSADPMPAGLVGAARIRVNTPIRAKSAGPRAGRNQ